MTLHLERAVRMLKRSQMPSIALLLWSSACTTEVTEQDWRDSGSHDRGVLDSGSLGPDRTDGGSASTDAGTPPEVWPCLGPPPDRRTDGAADFYLASSCLGTDCSHAGCRVEVWIERNDLGDLCIGPDAPSCGPTYMTSWSRVEYEAVRGWIRVEDWSGWNDGPADYVSTHHNYQDRFDADFAIGHARVSKDESSCLNWRSWAFELFGGDGGVLVGETLLGNLYVNSADGPDGG